MPTPQQNAVPGISLAAGFYRCTPNGKSDLKWQALVQSVSLLLVLVMAGMCNDPRYWNITIVFVYISAVSFGYVMNCMWMLYRNTRCVLEVSDEGLGTGPGRWLRWDRIARVRASRVLQCLVLTNAEQTTEVVIPYEMDHFEDILGTVLPHATRENPEPVSDSRWTKIPNVPDLWVGNLFCCVLVFLFFPIGVEVGWILGVVPMVWLLFLFWLFPHSPRLRITWGDHTLSLHIGRKKLHLPRTAVSDIAVRLRQTATEGKQLELRLEGADYQLPYTLPPQVDPIAAYFRLHDALG